MLVPVNNVVKSGMPFASTYFDTDKRRYVEGKYCGRNFQEYENECSIFRENWRRLWTGM